MYPQPARRDTSAWITQVWAAFGVAIVLCAIGIWNAPSQDLDRAFVATGFFFCLGAAFSIDKAIRDNQHEQRDASMWVGTAWAFFGVAATLTGWGLFRMGIPDWQKWFLVSNWLFLVSSTFTLAKTLRDRHEADRYDAERGILPAASAPRGDED